jgi:hypothetical protein
VVTEESILEKPATLELETLTHLLDADLIVLSHSVVMLSEIAEVLLLELQLFHSMNLVTLDP